MDIQMMRSGKLGYEAPIVVVDRKYYTYSDAGFSIVNLPITAGELDQLSEAVSLLKQFAGFQHFQEIDGIVGRLEEKIASERESRETVMDMERNESVRGLEWLSVLNELVLARKVLLIHYQSFRSENGYQN
jgi:hypothetical protein